MTLGIIDVGTNSIHLLVGILGLNGKFHVILKDRDLTRLGDGGLAKGALTGRSMRRAIDVLKRYAQTLSRCQADSVLAVATSAVREARNGREFVKRARTEAAIPLRIISGRDEARLIYLGVLQAHRVRRENVMVAIGGGSMQIMAGDGAQVHYTTSLPLGCARLAERFIRHDPAKPQEIQALKAFVRDALRPVAKALANHSSRVALGSSATIAQLMMAVHLQTHRHPPHKKERLSITQPQLRTLVAWLSQSSAQERIRLPGLDPRREDLALSTGLTLLAWMELCKIKQVRYAPGSLREGLVIDYLIRHHQRKRPDFEYPLSALYESNGEPAAGRPRVKQTTRTA